MPVIGGRRKPAKKRAGGASSGGGRRLRYEEPDLPVVARAIRAARGTRAVTARRVGRARVGAVPEHLRAWIDFRRDYLAAHPGAPMMTISRAYKRIR